MRAEYSERLLRFAIDAVDVTPQSIVEA